MSKIIFVTFATHKERLFKNLIKSSTKNKIKLNIIGFNTKWSGWKNRARYILKYINRFKNNQLICCLDAFDSLILGNEEELYNKFIKYYKNYNIVFSNDTSENFFINNYKKKKFNTCKNNFISAGIFIGYNKYIKDFLIKFINSEYDDDQEYFTYLCNNNNNITIDLNNKLFYNIQYLESEFKIIDVNKKKRLSINNETPVIISAPGNVNINTLINKLGYTNYEYNYKYFINLIPNFLYLYKYEIIIIVVCIYIKFYSGID